MAYRFLREDISVAGGDLGYIAASKAILDALTNGRVTGITIVAGGTGYAVNDVVTLNAASAVAIFDCRAIVTAVSSGVVTGLQLISSGAFSTLPDTTNASEPTTGGTGSGLTVSVTVEANYSAAPNAAGSGYSVGDVVTLSGGSLHSGSSASQFVVTSVSSGAVVAMDPLRVGRYDTLPTNPVSTTGGGTGLTVDLTQTSWIHADAASEDYTDDQTEFSWWVIGVNSAGSNPVCGCKTISTGAFRFLGLKCATAFDSGLTFENQANASPGDYTSPASDTGCRLPSVDGNLSIRLSMQPRSMNIVLRTPPGNEHGYMGLFTPFIDSPATKYPFPMVCAGTTRSNDVGTTDAFNGRNNNDENSLHASIMHLGESGVDGPYLIRDLAGNWRNFEPSNADDAFRLWPASSDVSVPADVDAPNIETGSGTVPPASLGDNRLGDGSSGADVTGPFNDNTALNPSPFGDGGNDLYFLAPAIVYEEFGSTHQTYGELEGVFAINGRGLSSEDQINDAAGNVFHVFTDCNSSEERNYIAIREGD